MEAIYTNSVVGLSVFSWHSTHEATLEERGTSGKVASQHHNQVYAQYSYFKRKVKAIQITIIISI